MKHTISTLQPTLTQPTSTQPTLTVAHPGSGVVNTWHQKPIAEVLAQLQTSPDGLTDAEAKKRLAEYGPNLLDTIQGVSRWQILFSQFKNILTIILLIGVALSLFLGHTSEALVIVLIVILTVLLGYVQEFRAERALEALRQIAAPVATVLRNGNEIDLPARELVPGDIILLQTGDKTPADARLIESINLQMVEAVLTGESAAVEKLTEPLLGDDLAVGDRRNMVFAGTSASYGRGRAVVVATGMQTEFGKIATLLESVESTRTPLQENLDKVGRALAIGALVIVVVIVALGVWRGQPLVELLIFGIALAVAVVPEALQAVVTISLALGVQRMVQRHALVRRLAAVETLGCVSVICSDKTGTLTQDVMTVRQLFVGGMLLDVSGVGYHPQGDFTRAGDPIEPSEPLTLLLQAAALASDSTIEHTHADDGRSTWRVKGDPTEAALIVVAAKAGLHKSTLDSRYPRIHEVPFSSESKRMTTIHAAEGGVIAYAKGAPEVMLAACASHLTASGVDALEEPEREEVLSVAQQMADSALRVLAVAYKPTGVAASDLPSPLASVEEKMIFLGLVGMSDPPRPEVKEAIATCKAAGIRTVMITGDHPITAQAIGRELGLLQGGRVVTGAELEQMNDDQLQAQVGEIDIYARVSPAHKLRIVTALQERGHIVAMTGDGVNDAPALKKADIGIAMGISGTDVTREASAMTLTDDNFASIVAAVEEGRGIFDNIKKYLMFLLSSNLGEIGLMAGATLLGLPAPLSALQILYVNLATDGLPALALAIDPPDANLMQRAPRNPRTGIFTRSVVRLMTISGVWSTLANLALFWWALASGRTQDVAMTLVFVALVAIQFFNAYVFRSDRRSSFYRPFANRWLNLTILGEVLLLVVMISVPFLRTLFGMEVLSVSEWGIALLVAASVVPVLEVAKRIK